MSEWHPRVVKLSTDNVSKHENADKLSIANIDGFPVVFQTEAFQVPSLVAYIPEDTVMPDGTVIRSKKLRGVLSIGMLQPLPEGTWEEGQSVVEALNLKKVEEPDAQMEKEAGTEPCPFSIPAYTDIEAYQRYAYKNVFKGLDESGEEPQPIYRRESIFAGKEVVITEKLHGANARYVYKDGRLWVGSKRQVKKEGDCIWWKAAKKNDLATKLAAAPNMVVYGEVFGAVQNLRYGMGKGEVAFRAFDVFDLEAGKYLDYDDFVKFCDSLMIPTVPVLYRGPWNEEKIEGLEDGRSTLADHYREGFVIRPTTEDYDDRFGRVILKKIGSEYRENKGKSEKKNRKNLQSQLNYMTKLVELYKSLAEEAQVFVDRVEKGEVRSVKTYNAFKTHLTTIENYQGKDKE